MVLSGAEVHRDQARRADPFANAETQTIDADLKRPRPNLWMRFRITSGPPHTPRLSPPAPAVLLLGKPDPAKAGRFAGSASPWPYNAPRGRSRSDSRARYRGKSGGTHRHPYRATPQICRGSWLSRCRRNWSAEENRGDRNGGRSHCRPSTTSNSSQTGMTRVGEGIFGPLPRGHHSSDAVKRLTTYHDLRPTSVPKQSATNLMATMVLRPFSEREQ